MWCVLLPTLTGALKVLVMVLVATLLRAGLTLFEAKIRLYVFFSAWLSVCSVDMTVLRLLVIMWTLCRLTLTLPRMLVRRRVPELWACLDSSLLLTRRTVVAGPLDRTGGLCAWGTTFVCGGSE